MFFVCLFLAFVVILSLILKHGRSRHKILITVTIFMIMTGMTLWGYHDINFADNYRVTMNKGVFSAVFNEPLIFIVGKFLLALSIPCTLFCLLNKPKVIDEIDKPLEDQDDIG